MAAEAYEDGIVKDMFDLELSLYRQGHDLSLMCPSPTITAHHSAKTHRSSGTSDAMSNPFFLIR
jgi:hypothetical protein